MKVAVMVITGPVKKVILKLQRQIVRLPPTVSNSARAVGSGVIFGALPVLVWSDKIGCMKGWHHNISSIQGPTNFNFKNKSSTAIEDL